MEITEHQANMLRALADRKTLQACEVEPEDGAPFSAEWFNLETLDSALLYLTSKNYYVRIKPDVIVVNGIEVPAPERKELARGEDYFLAASTNEQGFWQSRWKGDEDDAMYLRMQILHKSREAAAAHGKAMRSHKPG